MQDSVVIWDGECNICRKTIEFVSPRCASGALFVPAQQFSDDELDLLGLTRESVSAAMALCDLRGVDDVRFGYDAFLGLARHPQTRGLWKLAFLLPGAAFVGRRVYERVASSRKHLGCRGQCSIVPRTAR